MHWNLKFLAPIVSKKVDSKNLNFEALKTLSIKCSKTSKSKYNWKAPNLNHSPLSSPTFEIRITVVLEGPAVDAPCSTVSHAEEMTLLKALHQQRLGSREIWAQEGVRAFCGKKKTSQPLAQPTTTTKSLSLMGVGNLDLRYVAQIFSSARPSKSSDKHLNAFARIVELRRA